MIDALLLALALTEPTDMVSRPAEPPTELLELHVVRGDLILGRVDGRLASFRLAGVWVPTPSGHAATPHYMGDEARDRTADFVRYERLFIDLLDDPSAEQPWTVRIRSAGPESRDLSVVLAEAGYALCDERATPDPHHAQKVCSAEKRARRSLRGMHDGGFMPFSLAQRKQRSLGLVLWLPALLANRPGRAPGASRRSGYSSVRGGDAFFERPMVSTLHGSPVAAIRDWGREVGLPPDASSIGR